VNTTGIGWLRGLWRFYLAYTKTGVHAAATAGLAIFGLLVFVDDAFVILAIASYVLPPVVLYVLADDPAGDPGREESPTEAMLARDVSRLAEGTTTDGSTGAGERRTDADGARRGSVGNTEASDSRGDAGREDGGADSAANGGDGDTDGEDADSDTGDADSDSDDGDTDSDSDSDDGDSDSGSDDGDTDSDSDN
jgi:hypothetical protein